MAQKIHITIGRELGSGGLDIGKMLAEKLGIPCYDKELINMASKASGIQEEFFVKADEKKKSPINAFFAFDFSTLFSNGAAGNALDCMELFKIQSDVIKGIAEKESAVFVGRCADYILRENEELVSVFITAPIEGKVKRVREVQGYNIPDIKNLTDEEVAEYLKKGDKKRADYYNYFSYKEWGKATSYNLCIDSVKFGLEGCVDAIAQLVR